MNYLNQINGFWATAENDDLTAIDISVYFAILKYCNGLNWLNPFVCHWHIVCQYSKCSKNSFYNSVYRLHDKKYISYRKGERNKLQPKITVLEFKNNKGTIREQLGNSKGTGEEHEGNLYKLLNIKTIKLLEENYILVNSNLKEWIGEQPTSDHKVFYFDIDYSDEERIIKSLKENLKITDAKFTEYFDEFKLTYLNPLNAEEYNNAKTHFVNWIKKRKIKKKGGFGKNKDLDENGNRILSDHES